jgi:hypothetical protein
MDAYAGAWNEEEEDVLAFLGELVETEKARTELDQLQKDLDQLFVEQSVTTAQVEKALPFDLAKIVGAFVNDTEEFVSYPRLDGDTLRRLRVRANYEHMTCAEEALPYRPEFGLPENQPRCVHRVNQVTEFCAEHAWTPEIRLALASSTWTQDPTASFVVHGPVTQSPQSQDSLRVSDKRGKKFCDFAVVHSGEKVESARDFHFPRSQSLRLYSVLTSKREIV